MPAAPPVERGKPLIVHLRDRLPAPFEVGPLKTVDPIPHAQEELKGEPLEYSTTLTYPFRSRLPAWFVDYYKKSDGDNMPPGDLSDEEKRRWESVVPEGMDLDTARRQIYEDDFLQYSKDIHAFHDKKGKVSRVEKAALVYDSVRQTLLQNPDDPTSRMIATMEKATQRQQDLHREKTGRTYADEARLLMEDFRATWLEESNLPGGYLHGIGFEATQDEDDPAQWKRVPLMSYSKEKFMSVFADPDFDFGALGPENEPLLTPDELVTIWQHQVPVENLTAQRLEDGSFQYRLDLVEMSPLLKEIAPDQYRKLQKEVSHRLGLPENLTAVGGYSLLRGAVPFGDKMMPMTEEQSRMRAIIDPSYETKELVGGIGSLFAGGGVLYKGLEKLHAAGKVSKAGKIGLLLSGDAALGITHTHSTPGLLASMSGKPDNYALNALEAAALSGVFQLGFAGYAKLKGRQLGDLGDEVRHLDDMTPEEIAGMSEHVKKRLNMAPEEIPVVPHGNVIHVGVPTKYQRVRNWGKRLFTKEQGLPPESAYWQRRADARIQSRTLGEMGNDLAILRDKFQKHFEGKNLAQNLEDLNRALTHGSPADLMSWPQDMIGVIKRLRNHRKNLTKEIQEMAPGLSEELKFTLDRNMNDYLHRSYRLTDQYDDWVKRMLPPEGKAIEDPRMRVIYDRAFAFVKDQSRKDLTKIIKAKSPGKSVKEIADEVDNLLPQRTADEIETFLRSKWKHSDIGTDVPEGAKGLIVDILKKRKNIPVPIRNLMGEYSNPFLNYEKTILKMSNHIEKGKMFSNTRVAGMQNGWVFPDSALKPTVEELTDPDILKWHYGKRGETFMPGPKMREGNLARQQIRTGPRYAVNMPPSHIDGAPTTRIFRSKKAAQKWLDDEWAKTPHHKNVGDRFAKAGKEHGGFIQLPNTKEYGALAGHHVRQDYALALMEFNKTHHATSRLGKLWMGSVGAVNVSKTIFSHTTHIRNMVGGYWINAANGRFWLKGGKNQAALMLEDLRKLPDKEAVARVAEYRELSLMTGDVQLRHIDEAFKDSGLRAWLEAPPEEAAALYHRWAAKAYQGAGKVPGKVYGQVDNFMRITAYENELLKLTKAYESWGGTPAGWSVNKEMPAGFYHAGQKAPMTLKQYTAELVNDTYQNYDNLSKAIQNLKVTPFGQFVSFHAEMYRTTKNSFKLGWSQARHPNPAIKAIGAKRLASLMALGVVGPTALKDAWNTVRGIPDDKAAAINHFLPNYQKNNEINVLTAGKGRAEYFDFSYNSPYRFISNPLRAAWNTGSWSDVFDPTRGLFNERGSVASEVLGPAGDVKILAGAVFEAASGKDQYGREIYLNSDSKDQIGLKVADHISKVLPPRGFGSVQSIGKLYEIGVGKREGSFKWEAIANLTGMKRYDMNLLDEKMSPLINKGFDYSSVSGDASKIWKEVMVPGRQAKNLVVTVDEQVNGFKAMNQRLFEGQRELYKTIVHARALMLPDKATERDVDRVDQQIFRMLNSDTTSPRVSKMVFFGNLQGRVGGRAVFLGGVRNGLFVPTMPSSGAGEKAERRGAKYHELEMKNQYDKYYNAALSLEEPWTNTPAPRKPR